MERIAILTDAFVFAPCQRVILRAVVAQGRQALRVELQHGLGPEAMFQKPTFVIISTALSDGIVEVDILARRSRGALPASQASAGVAYRINGSARAFEAVYLCPVNGRPMKPPAPLDRQAVKYFAYPEHLHAPIGGGRLAGSFEAGADIRPDSWIGLKLEINVPASRPLLKASWFWRCKVKCRRRRELSGCGWTSAPRRISAIFMSPRECREVGVISASAQRIGDPTTLCSIDR